MVNGVIVGHYCSVMVDDVEKARHLIVYREPSALTPKFRPPDERCQSWKYPRNLPKVSVAILAAML